MTSLPIFEKSWQNAKKAIFRLESLPEYSVEEDLVSFEKWKRGEADFALEGREWFELLENTKKSGVQMQRVRIVDLPLSKYLLYEIDFWKHSVEKGEEFLFLTRDKYNKIKEELRFQPKDFWLFDDKTLIIFHYGLKGEWVGEELIENAKLIEQHANLKQHLLKLAIPMLEFLKNHPTT